MSATIILPDTFAHWSDALLARELADLRQTPGHCDRDRMAYALWADALQQIAQARRAA